MVDYCERGDVSLRARVVVIPVRALRVVISVRSAFTRKGAKEHQARRCLCRRCRGRNTQSQSANARTRAHNTKLPRR
jgi:hypothetical protein